VGQFSIKDLEHLSGIKAHTLRIWEQRYNIINPKRTETNIRYYDDDDLKRILNISLLNDHGFKISKIAQMPPEAITQEVMQITETPNRHSDQIQALTISMIQLDELRFEKRMATNILHHGFENTMMEIVIPFLLKIGMLWQTGAINPAHEHFITCLIRQKIIVAIDGLVTQYQDNRQKFMLFLPEGELHELTLLFAQYMIKARKHQVIYLGQNLPLEDLGVVSQIHEPDYMLCIITTAPGQAAIQDYINNLSKRFPTTQLLLTGWQVVGQNLKLPPQATILYSFKDLSSIIDKA
jgi:MerR family transcriptional regulator, light-induced transcriptional regulator